ncbi:DUF4238 domain-containing protein [uncultured Lutibacter sp.]|uniref:DUF4238 domain-containing protein n=1 Tax=uncultured Lutibacter sp. TaxID=437739 RepID=UPI0026199BB4|nr:DUF4238 domain-containing protein [uncultured Lutibacter sp.]
MKNSERHHYIPEFFIKGFIGDDGKLSVFDKTKGEISKLRKSPKQVFFDWNRNTFEVNGIETDFVENLYQFGENMFAPTFKKLTEKFEPILIEPYDLLHLFLFIATTHWRVPSQDNTKTDYSKFLGNENSFFSLKNKEKGKNVSKEIYERILNEPAFKESTKIMRAVQNFIESDTKKNVDNWKLYYTEKGMNQFNLLSDNPLILWNENCKNILNSESIFPLSKGKIIYHTNGKKLLELQPTHRISVDILAFINADKMVCGSNKEYLLAISKLAQQYDTDRKIELLKYEVFKIFK